MVCGAAQARTIVGTYRADRLTGTYGADTIYGRGGNDAIEGKRGADFLSGGPGADILQGGDGNDRIAAHADQGKDTIQCGLGRDVANAELGDSVTADCEIVSRQLSRDPFLSTEAQRGTEVEPDSFSYGATVVTAFQVGRFADGGAVTHGWATSKDGGKTWRSGLLPELTRYSTPRGAADRVSDPAVGYDAAHGVWLIVSLADLPAGEELVVSRSRDGLTWSAPVTVAHSSTERYDKPWIVCDNWRASPRRGRCYLSYLDLQSDGIATVHSSNGGVTWSGPALPPADNLGVLANGAQPVALPNGTLVVLYSSIPGIASEADPMEIVAVRSTDGGASFDAPQPAAPIGSWQVGELRAPTFVSAEADRGGTIYIAWHDECSLECNGNAIFLSKSRDGSSWSAPTVVPTRLGKPGSDYLLPGIGVDRTTSGRRARVAITYYALEFCSESAWCSHVDVGAVVSQNGGASWSRPQRLNAEPMQLAWISDTSYGRMLGDYISTSWASGRAVSVFALAAEPRQGGLSQSIFATRLPR